MNIGLVVMASGLSARFGRNKLLEQVGGKPLIVRALDAIPDAFKTVVVTRYQEIIRIAENYGFETVINTLPDQSDTIKLGLARLPDTDGACFMVADQPWLTRDTVDKLLNVFLENPGRIVRTASMGRMGNPVIFPKALYGEIMSLGSCETGGAVIKRHPDLVLAVETPMRELLDVDTVNDLLQGG